MQRRPGARRSSWPVVLCGLVACASACAAFLTSPAGQRPEVQRVTSAAVAQASQAVDRAASLLEP